MALSINDSLSHANSEDYVTDHLHFDWFIDFDRKVITGTTELTLSNISKNKTDLRLDVSYLSITEVRVQGSIVKFEVVDDTIEILGSCLKIPINSLDEKLIVTVNYSTTDKCSALQWMNPQATKGKLHPYLYSQCQAIHGRSLFPCQDTPSVKSTYSAKVKAVRSLNVLMSAIKDPNIVTDSDTRIHSFAQTVRIPSYLVAIVCGNLAGRTIGPRSTVWSEPEMVDQAAEEFADTESLLLIGEEYCGPYVWGIYDLLVLPPSFPYGGMENPCLTFVTPALLVGDKSLVSVVAHEISHSWTGNLVTNKTWNDLWLNEGHTTYLESLLTARYCNKESIRQLMIQIGLADLKDSLTDYGKGHQFNQLVPDLIECDPDDVWSIVPYEKGQQLLLHLESICGKEKMLRWLKSYVNQFKFLSITTDQWKAFFYKYMTEHEQIDVSTLDSVDWTEWFKGTWEIPWQCEESSILGDECHQLARQWTSPMTHSLDNDQQLLAAYQSIVPHQRYYMLQVLNDLLQATLTGDTLELMGRLYGFRESSNSEILLGWSLLCIRARYEPAVDQIFSFLNSHGRMKYNKPLYKNLYNWPEMRQRTIENFHANRSQLNPITEKCILHILNTSAII